MPSRVLADLLVVRPSISVACANESWRLIDSTSLGARSSSRAIATFSDQPPQATTRANSQWRPVETAIVVRSWPMATATSAPELESRSSGASSERRSANASRSMPTTWRPARRHACEVAVDDLAIGDDEEDALPLGAVLAHLLVEDDVVEHGLVERDREHLLGSEADRVLELQRVGDALDLEDADADAVVGDPEADAALRQLVKLEEALQRVAERLGVANLARDDEARLERLAEDLDELGCAVVDDLRGRELGRADLEADELLRALVLARLAERTAAWCVRARTRRARPLRARSRPRSEPGSDPWGLTPRARV